ncbi:MAG: hypothetical protein AVDCRST_MAG79-2541, partial [uncultured Thermoleophilia bacterium]
MPETEQPDTAPSRLDELRGSARGWHGVQLAVLGFIGLCGVLTEADPSEPGSLQVVAGLLALTALAVACLATYLVARAAWPLYGPRPPSPTVPEPDDLRATSRRLTRGIALTFVSVALLALSAASGWWPTDDEDAPAAAVEVRAQGGAWCGRLGSSPDGGVVLVTTEGRVAIPLEALTAV